MGSNPGEDMDVCKRIVPLRHGVTLNSRRAASPLEWLVEGEESWTRYEGSEKTPSREWSNFMDRLAPVSNHVIPTSINNTCDLKALGSYTFVDVVLVY
ncbi:hypothetical protein TNCV_181411 [Trichonephila clavipes]|nr:hypothetical protein TNCV_181411 [Trichonephila clavipes]